MVIIGRKLKMDFMLKTFMLVGVLVTVTNCTLHTIGFRTAGDRLVINDTLRTTPTPMARNHTLEFNYPIKNAITCIEFYVDSDVHAEYSLSVNKVLRGIITAIDVTDFELHILVFGIEFNATTDSFHALLNSVAQMTGTIYPDEEYDEYDYDDDVTGEFIPNGILTYGERQPGDKLIFKTFESTPATLEFARHSLIFRYIDSHYLTCAKFIALKNREPGAIFSHISDHSIKAEVYTLNAHTLDVEFLLYGYEPGEKPKDYKHFLNANITGSSGGLNGGGAAVPIAGWAPAGFMLYITISIWLCLF